MQVDGKGDDDPSLDPDRPSLEGESSPEEEPLPKSTKKTKKALEKKVRLALPPSHPLMPTFPDPLHL